MSRKSQRSDQKNKDKKHGMGTNSNIIKAFGNLKNQVHTIRPGHMYSCQFMGSLTDTDSGGIKKKIFYEEKSV